MSPANTSAAHQKSDPSLNLASFWEQRLSQNPSLVGVGHIGFSLAYNQWMYRLRRAVFLRHVRSLGVDFRKAEVLDVGSGVGFWIRVWRSLGVQSLTGSDITAFATQKIAVENPGIRAVQLDIASPAVQETLGGKYDLVSAIDMLYHIVSDADYEAAFANLSQLLKSGGHLIITENLLHQSVAKTPVQSNRTLNLVMELLARNGLSVIRRAPVFVLMNYPVDTRSALLKRLWLLATLPASYLEFMGNLYGALLYPMDLALTKLLKEGPSTEILICRKP
jgi:2-polyprenyl-3-methyl-5-hydroxy-6-metoxy-1,4-benzoquinol methylase